MRRAARSSPISDADATCDPELALASWPAASSDPAVVAAGGPNLPYAGRRTGANARSHVSPGVSGGGPRRRRRAPSACPGCNMAFRSRRPREPSVGSMLATRPPATTSTSAGSCWTRAVRSPSSRRRRSGIDGERRFAATSASNAEYGRAERMLAAAHGHRFNRLGQARWRGAIYQPAGLLPRMLRPIVYHGHQGHAPFQHVVSRRSDVAQQWIGALLPFVVPAVAASVALTCGDRAPGGWSSPRSILGVVGYGSAMAASAPVRHDETRTLALRHLLVGFAARGATVRPGVGQSPEDALQLVPRIPAPAWWGSRAAWLTNLERALLTRKIGVRIGGPSDDWDLEARLGLSLRARVTTGVAWQRSPMHRRRWMPPRATAAVVAAVVGLAVGSGQLGAARGRGIDRRFCRARPGGSPSATRRCAVHVHGWSTHTRPVSFPPRSAVHRSWRVR